jgi:amino acid adenylation domain-containing protein/FkbH-like protein
VATKSFWSDYLLDYKTEATIPAKKSSGYKLSKEIFYIDEEKSKRLNLFAQKYSITLNTLMQTVWGVILAKINSSNDVVFGATVSGRVDEIDGIEKMVGLFINAIPIRVKFQEDDTLLDLLKRIMQESVLAKKHHYYSLADIQSSTVLKDNLIKQLMVFENYPASEDASDSDELKIKMLDNFSQTNYDFDITVVPSDSIKVMFKYNSFMYDDKTILSIKNSFLKLIEYIIESPEKKISDTSLGEIPTIKKEKSYDIFISSTFTADPIKESLEFWGNKFDINLDISFSGYNQVFQDLLNQNSPIYRGSDLTLLLIRFEDVLRFLNLTSFNDKIKEIDDNYEQIVSILESIEFDKPIFIPIFKPAKSEVYKHLTKLYEKFYKKLSDKNNIYLIDFRELKGLYQVKSVFDLQQDKAGHIPFSDEYFGAMGGFLARKIYAFLKPHFKVIALDCDNTLWGGVVGEDGVDGVDISRGFLELQKFIIEREKEGFLIVLNSKNNENDIWELFEKSDKMLLKKEHIVHSKINWQPKSQNLKEMAKELNLGLNSFIFLDDNPLECSEVIKNAPEVLSIPIPKEQDFFKLFLNHIWAFDKVKVTAEDRKRTKMYKAETQRDKSSKKLSMDDFLASLELKIYMNKMFDSQLARVSQLTNRTNQFNVSTIRRSESDIKSLLEDKNYVCWSINVEDKFGDYGLVGVIISQRRDNVLFIDTFLMSCRVLGRGVENSILSGLRRYAKEHNLTKIEMDFYPTKKNRPALDFIESSYFKLDKKYDDKTRYYLIIDELSKHPSFVEFLFDKDESIFDSKKEVVVQITESNDTVEIKDDLDLILDDFDFNFLDSIEQKEIDKLLHSKFYEPLKFHKASDTIKLLNRTKIRESSTEFIAPQTKTELELAKIYKELLSLESVGVNDCFFELGGHSLMATRLLSRVYQSFKIELSMQTIFENSTIKSLSRVIDSEDKNNISKVIPIATKMSSYPLSNAQKRVWLIDKIGGSVAYNMPIALELVGELDVDKLESVLNQIISRHEILRTEFILVDGEPNQRVIKSFKVKLDVVNGDEKSIREVLKLDATKTFDLSKTPLFRVKLFKIDSSRYIFYFNTHHIISDGWSLGVITDEINRLYSDKSLEPLKIQYKDYTIWQNRLLASKDILTHKEYWHKKLEKEIEPLKFPTDFPRFKQQTFSGDSIKLDLSEFVSKIDKFNREETTTLFMFLTSAVKVILAKYSNQNDITLGFPISGRDSIELENQIGFYANTLVLRDEVDFENDFNTLIKQVKQTILEAHTHQQYPFEKLVNELNISRDIAHSPLFDYAISLNSDQSQLNLGSIAIKPFELEFKVAQFDMSFNFGLFEKELVLDLNYNRDLFKESSVKRVLKHFKALVSTLLDNPTKSLKDIEFFNSKKEYRVSKEYKEPITKLFAKQVKLSPDSGAVSFYNKSLTYKELDKLSNRVANYLIDREGIKEGDVVAFKMDRSELSVVTILATLKSQATFLPINSSLPQNRVDFILKDSNSKLLLTKESLLEAISYNKSKKIKRESSLNSSSYIIYTSGTTGNPKGVEVAQNSLLNLCKWYIDDLKIDKDSRVLLMIPTSFDASIKNILAPLFVGGEVIISKEQFDSFELLNIIKSRGVNLINCVPSAFKSILESSNSYKELKSIKTLAFGGESLDISDFKDFYLKSNIKLFNIYGPTEACDISTIYEVTKDDLDKKSTPIGKEIPNAKIYILDSFGNIVPTNVIGELVVAGRGVAKGYVNSEKLTNEKFVTHPKIGRVYKTGDLARELDSGDIEFIGRVDDQVKIRGNRVELSEIKQKILEIDAVESAFVLVKSNSLVAFIKSSSRIKLKEIREYLQNSLPSYMVPTDFIKIKDVPLTQNGKVDNKKLLSIKIKSKKLDKKTLSKVEKKLLTIFEEVLNRDIVVDDNFFEVGGDSLSAIKVVSKVNKAFKKELKLSTIFEYQTIKSFAIVLEKVSKGKDKPYTIFNKKSEKTLLMFPALIDSIDYKITPSKLSKELKEYKIYAFDFITDEDRISKYASIINSLKEEFIVLGYSSGGNLAFEVVKELKKEPKELILVDSWRIKKFNSLKRDEVFNELKDLHLDADSKRRINIYIEMLNSMRNFGKIETNIELIKSLNSIGGSENRYLNQNWKDLTRGIIKEYLGFGEHLEMLKDNYLIKNCKLIKKILEGRYVEN